MKMRRRNKDRRLERQIGAKLRLKKQIESGACHANRLERAKSELLILEEATK